MVVTPVALSHRRNRTADAVEIEEMTGEIVAGTPVLFKFKDGVKKDINISAPGANIVKAPVDGTAVTGDDGRTYGIYSAALLDGMKALSRKADVITPNLTEACLLADYDIEKVYSDTRKDVLLPLATEISEKLRDLSGKNQDVIITGIKCRDDKAPFIYNLVTTANVTTTHRSHFFDVSSIKIIIVIEEGFKVQFQGFHFNYLLNHFSPSTQNHYKTLFFY